MGKRKPLKKYEFRGSAKLRNVYFTVVAASLEEAQAKAARGEYEDTDTSTAEWVDWELEVGSGREGG